MEVILAIFLVGVISYLFADTILAGHRSASFIDRRSALTSELARQIAEARTLPLNTILNGGKAWRWIRAGTEITSQETTEPFFGGETDIWIKRDTFGNPELFGIYTKGGGSRNAEVHWFLGKMRSPASNLNFYEIRVEVRVKDGIKSGEDLVALGSVVRGLEDTLN